MHEYGHYIQSQQYDPGYLVSVGVPSIFSAKDSKDYGYYYDSEGNLVKIKSHNLSWMEIGANKKAEKYFRKNYNIEWGGSKFNRYFTEYPDYLIKY